LRSGWAGIPRTKGIVTVTDLHDARDADELRLLDLLEEDYATHDRDPLQPGLWAVAVHRLGRRALAAGDVRARAALDAGYRVLSTAVDWLWGIYLPRSVKLGRRVRIWHSGCIVLAAREIGNDVHLRQDTTLGPAPQVEGEEPPAPGLPTIEDRADIGAGACVLGAVTVGRDALVGANSVVVKSVPPGATVLGVPARIVPA
jgi:serine O-acetyltransferase